MKLARRFLVMLLTKKQRNKETKKEIARKQYPVPLPGGGVKINSWDVPKKRCLTYWDWAPYPFTSVPVRKFCVKLSCSDDFRLVADARERRLCSTERQTCVVTQIHSTFGDRAFAAADPGLCDTSQRYWLAVQSVPAVTKDIFVWIVGPRRSVNFLNCAV